MSTAFKVTEKKKGQAPTGRRTALGNTKSTAEPMPTKSKDKDRLGTTLVAATPVKPKPKAGRSFSSAFPDERDVLPFIIDEPNGGIARLAVEGGDDDDDWMPQSSPDILLLTDEDRSTSPGGDGLSEDTKGRSQYGRNRMLVESTPTKSHRR